MREIKLDDVLWCGSYLYCIADGEKYATRSSSIDIESGESNFTLESVHSKSFVSCDFNFLKKHFQIDKK